MYERLFSPAQQEERKGEYWEEVELIADTIVGAIRDGELTSRRAVEGRVNEAAGLSTWISPDFAPEVLLWSEHPNAAFGTSGHVNMGKPTSETPPVFPFGAFAQAALAADVLAQVQMAPWHKDLPESTSVKLLHTGEVIEALGNYVCHCASKDELAKLYSRYVMPGRLVRIMERGIPISTIALNGEPYAYPCKEDSCPTENNA